MIPFLSTGLPPEHLTLHAKRRLAVKSQNFCLVPDTLHHKGSNSIWRRVVQKFEKEIILRKTHNGIAKGHYVGDATARKVWQSGLWWPTT